MDKRYQNLMNTFSTQFTKRGNFFWGDIIVFGFLPHKHDVDGVLLNLLELDRDKCGHGIGSKYLNELKATCVAHGFNRIYVFPCPLDKTTKEETVKRFYRKNQFFSLYGDDTFMVWWDGFLKKVS